MCRQLRLTGYMHVLFSSVLQLEACPKVDTTNHMHHAATPTHQAHMTHATGARCSLLLAGVRLVVEAVCVLMGVKPTRVKDAQSVECVDSYVAAGQKMLADDNFLRSLM